MRLMWFLTGSFVGCGVMAIPLLCPPAEARFPPPRPNLADLSRVEEGAIRDRRALREAEADVARLLVVVTDLRVQLDAVRRGGVGVAGVVDVPAADLIPPQNLPVRP